MEFKIKGKIIERGETKEYGSNGFKKRTIVIETEEQYPQFIPVDFTQSRCEILDKYNVGDVVNIFFNVKGREWTNTEGENKYFLNIQGWKIEKANNDSATKQNAVTSDSGNNEDDLPF